MQLKWEKKLHRLSSIVSACFIIFAIIGAILNLSLFLFNTDAMHVTGMHSAAAGSSNPIIYLYKSNTLTGIFVGLCLITFLLAVILAVVMIVRKKRCSQLTLPERRGALQIIRIFAGFALLAIPVIYAVFSLYGFELGKFRGTINRGAMLIALPASLYFLFPGIADRFSEFLQTIFGMCLIVFAILSAMTTHVYMYEGLTSPVRIMNLLSMTALMLFTLYELRFFASRPLPNMYLATAGLATFFCATNGLPRLILTFIGEMSVSVQTIYACFEVTIALYAACRMMLFLSEWSYTMQNAAIEDEQIGRAHV